jgi:pilus assembly protein FimV
MQVDVELDTGGESLPSRQEAHARTPERGNDSLMSISATTLDEHFEANPVMELAEIMLSFGRVKGAAQALQEYIDQNPQEALQPWIRLMDVYRMAGMRAEFENVARNLNVHFNVEVQHWDEALVGVGASSDSERPVGPRPRSLEDLPRLMNTIVDLWGAGDVVGYLYQLLRDNRGGQRTGFALPVVEDVLFLIELKETANRMEPSYE